MRAAFFDLDKTVIARSSTAAFGPSFHRQGLIRRRTVIRALIQQLLFLQFGADDDKIEKIRTAMLKITKGWSQDRVSAIVTEALSEVIEPIIFEEALLLIESHKESGDLVYLVSAAPEEIVTPLAALFNVDGSLASAACVDSDNCYTGEVAFYCYGPNKAIAVRELAERKGIDLEESFAYSDSSSDIPLLEAVGHPFAVNPDKALAARAKDGNWTTLRFARPVALRRHLHRNLAIAGISISVAAATTVATISLVHALKRLKSS